MRACEHVCPPAVDDSLPGNTWDLLCCRQLELRTAEVSCHVTRTHHLVYGLTQTSKLVLLLIRAQYVRSYSTTGEAEAAAGGFRIATLDPSEQELRWSDCNAKWMLKFSILLLSSNLPQSDDICPFILLSQAKVKDLLPSPYLINPSVPLHFLCAVNLFSCHVGGAAA